MLPFSAGIPHITKNYAGCYNMPDFHEPKSCKKASAHCKLQKRSCFKKAGMPHALD